MLTNLPLYIANTRKAIIQLTGLITALLALGLLPNKYAVWGAAAVAVLTTITHFMTSNAPAPGTALAVGGEETVDDVTPPPEWRPSEIVTASQVASNQQIEAPPSP